VRQSSRAGLLPGLTTRVAGALGRLAIVAVVAVTACADFEGSVDPTFGLPDVVPDSPTLARDVQPLFDRRCAFGGCHSVATRQAGLVLVRGSSHAALVNRRSQLQADRTLVVPGDASASWLKAMISADHEARMGYSRMPLAATPLTPNQIATIARWIDRGAPENE
jgi:hypothetical protein